MKLASLFVAVLFSFAAFAEVSELDRLEYQNNARQAANKKFLAKLEVGKARSESARAQFVYDMVLKLRDKNASTAFELSDAKLKILESAFAEKRGVFHLEEATLLESIALARVAAIETGKSVAKEIATLNHQLCEKRVAVLEALDVHLVPYVKEWTLQFEGSRTLLGKGAISRDSFNKISLVFDTVNGLVTATKAEIVDAKRQLEEATREVAANN